MSKDKSLQRKILEEMQMLDAVSFQQIKKEIYADKFTFKGLSFAVLNDLRAELDEFNLCIKANFMTINE